MALSRNGRLLYALGAFAVLYITTTFLILGKIRGGPGGDVEALPVHCAAVERRGAGVATAAPGLAGSTLVVYAFYDRDEQYRDNLGFFTRHGVEAGSEAVDYLFVVNGESAVELPSG